MGKNQAKKERRSQYHKEFKPSRKSHKPKRKTGNRKAK